MFLREYARRHISILLKGEQIPAAKSGGFGNFHKAGRQKEITHVPIRSGLSIPPRAGFQESD